MTHLDMLKRYLARDGDVDIPEHGFPFVTISREPGAGGHTLGREIIREIESLSAEPWARGWDLFDQKLCAVLAQDPETQANFESLIREDYKSGLNQSVYEMFVGRAEEHVVQKRIAAVVRFLAYAGRVVIIGRGGMCLTREFPAGLHIRLVAQRDVRIRRMMEALDLDEPDAAAEVARQERSRARLIRDYHDRDIADPLLYDMVFNTSTMDTETMAGAVARIVATRWKETEKQKVRPFQT